MRDCVGKGSTYTEGFYNSSNLRNQGNDNEQNNQGANNPSDVDDARKTRFLKTGTEHWRTIYQQTVGANKGGLGNGTNNGFGSQKNFSQSEVGNGANNQENGPNGQNGQGTGFGNTGNNFGNTGASLRSNSLGGKTRAQLAEEAARTNSFKTKPYINNAKTGVT